MSKLVNHVSPKRNYKPGPMDDCQTPSSAAETIAPFIAKRFRRIDPIIWEPACGEGYLVDGLRKWFRVIASDVKTGLDFLELDKKGAESSWKIWKPKGFTTFNAIVTNPPYSLKRQWLARCYALGKPFALLMPVEWLGAKGCLDLIEANGIEMIFLKKRINFKMPNKKWDGAGATFPVTWYTWGLKIGREITIVDNT